MPETVTLDVRPDFLAGREPFSKIIAAARAIPPGGTLILLAPFDPVPLYDVLRKQGFGASTESLGGAEGYRVTFVRKETAPA